MKKGKRLLVMLLATLVMVAGAFSAAYAAYEDHYVYRIHSSGSTSTVTCEENDTHIYINISRDNATYDGSGKEASVSVTTSNGYEIDSQSQDRYYFKYDESGDSPGPENAGSIKLGTISYSGTTRAGNNYSGTTAPSEAGDYTASVQITAYDPYGNSRGTLSISKSFTINPKSIEVVWTDNSGTDPEDAWTYYYNGENHAPTAKITTGLVQGDGVDVTVSGAAKTVADHTATAKLVGPDSKNYVVSNETQDFTIAPKPIKVTWAGDAGSSEDFDFTYNAEERGPTCTIDANQIVKGESCTVTVTGQQKNVGVNYTATATLSNENYVIDEEDPSSSSHAFSISKKDVSFTWDPTYTGEPPKNPEFTYNGAEQGPEATNVQGIVDGDDCSIEVSGQQTVVGKDYTATAELTGASKDNYNLTTTSTQKFDIVANTIVTLKWSPESFVYNADYQCPEAEITLDGDMKEGDCELTYTVHKGTEEGEVVPEGTKMPVGTYVVVAALVDKNNFAFGDTQKEWTFTVTRKIVEVALDIEDPMYYDADYHKPEITTEDIFDVDKDTCRPAVSLKGRTLKGVAVDIPDCNDSTLPKDQTGVIHASSGKYTAKVEELVGDDSSNYELKKNTQLKFTILPKEVSLDWFRPAYDAYGDETGEEPVKVNVDEGEKLNLVFNGKAQAPEARIEEDLLLKNAVTEVKDKCTVTVSAPSNAIEASETPYKAIDIKFSNPDYTRDSNGTDFYIIARPVKLKWDAKEKTYNGKEQKRTVEITNIQKTRRGNDYSADEGIGVVKVSKITYTPAFHFGTEGEVTDEIQSTFEGKTGYYTDEGEEEKGLAEGTEIAEDRTPVDAGTYVMTAAELSDPFNYTLVRIDPESVELDPAVIPNTEDEPWYVDDHHPIYKIHQYEIKKIDWRNTTVTYNASNQKPIAEVNKSDLKGPDTNKEVAVMIHDDKNSTKDNFAGKCNAKTYDIYVLKNKDLRGIKGDRSMNYFIGETAKKMQEKFTINKKALTVTVLDKVGYYGDDPASYKHTVKYSGLVNGNVNKDDNHQNKNIPGKYTNDEGVTKDVVEGKLKYTTNYKKWGKYGKYYIKASGLKSDNYAIKYVDGKLTIKDRKLAGDLVAKANAGNKKATISWNKVHGAAKYQIYFSLCNEGDKKYEPKLYKTVSASTSSFTIKKLRKNTYYKFYVTALDKSGKRIASTPQHHFCTNNVCGRYTNPKSVDPSKTKVTLNKGKTYKLSATVTKAKAGKKLTNGKHTQKLRYKSANNKVATVSANGTIKAVGSGWCRIYVMGANGIWKVVEVSVK